MTNHIDVATSISYHLQAIGVQNYYVTSVRVGRINVDQAKSLIVFELFVKVGDNEHPQLLELPTHLPFFDETWRNGFESSVDAHLVALTEWSIRVQNKDIDALIELPLTTFGPDILVSREDGLVDESADVRVGEIRFPAWAQQGFELVYKKRSGSSAQESERFSTAHSASVPDEHLQPELPLQSPLSVFGYRTGKSAPEESERHALLQRFITSELPSTHCLSVLAAWAEPGSYKRIRKTYSHIKQEIDIKSRSRKTARVYRESIQQRWEDLQFLVNHYPFAFPKK